MSKGKFIVIEGTDGSGKATQAKLLAQALRQQGKKVQTIAFPQYGQKSAGAVEAYLNGVYGTPREVGPYVISILYGVDRAAARKKIFDWLRQGNTVIADRFSLSNHAYVGKFFASLRERRAFWRWTDDFEYRLLKLPKPDRVIVLAVPPRLAQRLILKKQKRAYLRNGKRDIHERDVHFQEKVLRTYRELARTKSGVTVVECAPGGKLLSKRDVHQRVRQALRGLV